MDKEIKLDAETSQRVRKRMKSGLYSNETEVVNTALSFIEEHGEAYEREIAEFRDSIKETIERSDREGTIPADVVFERLLKRNDEWAKRSE